MEITLLVLAAGMGSRYGGLKQMDPVGPDGETLLDYSVYDAVRAGFSRVVFVIRREFEEEFREKIGKRFEDRIDVGYVFQQLNDLPNGFSVPDGREKPWGTGHAIWCARAAIDSAFLAINADDFYGSGAISGTGKFLSAQALEGTRFCMAGYRLAATLSPSGHVSRGVCEVSPQNELLHIKEFTRIESTPSGIVNQEDGTRFSGEERVSMNCWGFTPAVFAGLEELFSAFLAKHGTGEKSEFYIPAAVANLITAGKAGVSVLPVGSQWFGVTYREDRPGVVSALASLVEAGEYPSPLWP
ncbi:MAG: NTP transferase domain-containing protein [Terrimicrobiaceae bacterium]